VNDSIGNEEMCDECKKLNDHLQNRPASIDVFVRCTHKKKDVVEWLCKECGHLKCIKSKFDLPSQE
jgi:hypothetical protein